MKITKGIGSILAMVLYIHTYAQKVKELSYPKGYFMFPIRPGQINHLSGNLGDLRANHFHGGLDIKTEQREGLPVYAAAAGYVKEIRITTSGYGNGLYIQHPNGMVTVYGHLKSYEGVIKQYAIQKRIDAESFELSIKPEANEIPVRKGEIIGLSGNSGGSGGPHLHFEIRNEFNNLLNPLYFGFKEIADGISPNIQGLILKPLDINARVSGVFGRQYYYPSGKGGYYTIPKPIVAKGYIGLELLAFDKMNFNHNNYGISCIEVLVNGREKFYYHLEKIPVEDSKDINLHEDYALEKIIGKKYQRLFLADGNNQLPIYKVDEHAGKLQVLPGESYNIAIKCWDSFENLSTLNFKIFGDTTTSQTSPKLSTKPESIDYQIDENTLVINLESVNNLETPMELGVNGKIVPLELAYVQGAKNVYLYDLRNGLPQYLEYGDIQRDFNFKKMIPSGQNFELLASNYQINFSPSSLYDTLYLEMYKNGAIYKIGESTIPLREPINVELLASNVENTANTSAYWIYGNTKRYLGGSWAANKIKFTTRDLGAFALLTDENPPEVKALALQKNRLAFRINDDLSGIRSFRAELDGKFVLMDYDYKKKLIWSVVSDSSANYLGNLKLSVVDNQGNQTIFEETLDENSTVAPVAPLRKKTTKAGLGKKSSIKKSTKTRKNTTKTKKKAKR